MEHQLPMKWIKCEDQHPEIGQNILVYQTYPEGTMFNCAQYPLNRCFHLIAEYTKMGNEHVFWNREMIPFKHITHWMPLPEKPE